MSNQDNLRVALIRECVDNIAEQVGGLEDERQRLLVDWQVKQLKLALKSYEKRARKDAA